MLRRAFVFGALAVISVTASAQTAIPFLDGGQKRAFDLYRSAAAGNEAALEELRSRANDGDRWSAMQFGYLHHVGRAPKVGKDIRIAMKAYRKAAKLSNDSSIITGNQFAAYNMGILYLYGEDGVTVDAAEAAKWFVAAAGDEVRVFVPAAMNLANLFEHGYDNVRQDLVEAGRWYRAAATKKEPFALYKLGAMLINGIGMATNQMEGRLKLSAAADLWSLDAMYLLAVLASQDRGIMEKNPQEAAKWLLIAADTDPRYKKLAQDAVTKLAAPQQTAARNAAKSWIRNHMRVPQAIDYRIPLNIDPSNN